MTQALLVIDVQNEYFPGGGLPLHQAEEVEGRIVAAIAEARRAGERVILVQHVSAAETGLFASGSPNSAIRPAIQKAAGDVPVVTKRFADAFQETDLNTHLEGVTSLLVCGMMTQNCVVFTAMSRLADELEITVIEDLCAAPTAVVHAIALNALKSKLPVRNAAEIWR